MKSTASPICSRPICTFFHQAPNSVLHMADHQHKTNGTTPKWNTNTTWLFWSWVVLQLAFNFKKLPLDKWERECWRLVRLGIINPQPSPCHRHFKQQYISFLKRQQSTLGYKPFWFSFWREEHSSSMLIFVFWAFIYSDASSLAINEIDSPASVDQGAVICYSHSPFHFESFIMSVGEEQ